ncbi:trimeric porin PorB [Neisseria sp. S1]|uniref:trimeric porin PorB n=1 Tax=Neisseria sp. S1 TaxID=3318354 RepID=UPI003A874F14
MKKTLIALTLAALPVAASADVILYGQIKAGVEVAQTKTTKAGVETKNDTTTALTDLGSRIGFKGHEHLGSGLNAIWQVENNVSVAGGGEWAARDSFIGLEGNFGKIRAGKLSTQLNDMGTVDPWEYSNNALGLGMFTRTGKRVTSVRYDSPVFAGFSANVQYAPRDNKAIVRGAGETTGRADNASDTSSYYGGLNYENAGFFAQYGVGYKKSAYVTTDGKSKSGQAHRVEAGYDANNLFAALGYQYTNGWDSAESYDAALSDKEYKVDNAKADKSAGVKTHEVAATAAYRFGNVTPRVSYAHGFDVKTKDGTQKGTKYDQVVLGADYDFSKRTTAMVSAGWLKAGSGKDKTQTTAGLVGLRHKF